jgi:lipoyl synthase
MPELKKKIDKAGIATRERFGESITFYIPGMVQLNGITGQYQAVSITGNHCTLQCEHCGGKLLESMTWATTPGDLVEHCIRLWEKGNHGVLISGGCNAFGQLPWRKFIPAIWEIKNKTGLFVSVHSGLADVQTAFDLKAAGVDQVLIDVIGDDETFQRIYHVSLGVSRIMASLEALAEAGLDVVPHVVCGLYFGKMRGEKKALGMISQIPVRQLVVVSMMKIPKTGSMRFELPKAYEVADFIAEARLAMPHVLISLGCARERGNREMEIMAIDAGVNRLALPSDEALAHCRELGIKMNFQATCCSVSRDLFLERIE